MRMTKPVTPTCVGLALIGAGMIAETHVAALSALQNQARLKAIVSRRPERAHHLADRYEGLAPEFTADLVAVAADPSISAVIVATPRNVRKDVIENLAMRCP